jgi:signal transduction histidine kinase
MRRSLAETLDRAEDLLIEARDRVSDLREAAPGGSLEDMLHEAVRHQQFPPSVEVIVTMRGTRQSISPDVRDDLATIVGEALFNASRHSHADRVDIELSYRWWGVELRIVDNGVGIPPAILEAGRREGHFGLTGMADRARRIGARLAVSSSPETGTSLTVRLRRAALRLPSTRPFLHRKPRNPKP